MEEGISASERIGLLSNQVRSRMNFSRLTIIKLIELVLACVIAWLHYKTFYGDGTLQLFFLTGTYAGFVVVVLGTFIGHVTGNSVNRTVDMFFCIVGAIFYIISGSISIHHFRNWRFDSQAETLGITMGSLAIIEGALFILDAFFVFRFD